MKTFIVETLHGQLLVASENAEALKQEIAARNLECEVGKEVTPEVAAQVMPMTVDQIPAELEKKPAPAPQA